MSGGWGYDPDRIVGLHLGVVRALDDLVGIHSADPAAVSAIAAAAEMRRVLGELWLPTLREIERVDPLVRAARRRRIHAVPAGPACTLDGFDRSTNWVRELSADELIAWLLEFDESWPRSLDEHFGLDPDEFEDPALLLVAHELARRLVDDPDLAGRLLDGAGHSDALALAILAGGAAFAPALVGEVAAARVGGPPPAGGPRRLERHDELTQRLLALIATLPMASAAFLADDWAPAALLDESLVGQEVVGAIITAATIDLVIDHPDRWDEALDAFLAFVPLAEATGFTATMSRHLAAAFGVFLEPIAPFLDAGNVVGAPGRTAIEIDGRPLRYDDLVSLFGRIVTDEVAQHVLVGLLDEHLTAALDTGLDDALSLTDDPFVLADHLRFATAPTTGFARLVFVDATDLEQERLDQAFARRRAASDQGFTILRSIASAIPGGGTGVDIARQAIGAASLASRYGRSDVGPTVPSNDADARLDGVLATEALARLASRPEAWSAAGLDGLSTDGAERIRAWASSHPPGAAMPVPTRAHLLDDLGLTGTDRVHVDHLLARITDTPTPADL